MRPTKFIALEIFIVFGLALRSTIGGAPAEIVLTQLETFILAPDYVNTYDFRLVPLRGRNVINGSFSYTRNMSKLNSRLVMHFEKPDRTRFQVLDVKVDICQMLNGDLGRQKLLKSVMQQLSEQNGFIQKCPIEANKTYYLSMYDIQMTQFPLPNLKIIVTVFAYDETGNRKIAEFRLKGATKRKN